MACFPGVWGGMSQTTDGKGRFIYPSWHHKNGVAMGELYLHVTATPGPVVSASVIPFGLASGLGLNFIPEFAGRRRRVPLGQGIFRFGG